MKEKSNVQQYRVWQKRAYVFRCKYTKYKEENDIRRISLLFDEVYKAPLRDFQKEEIIEIIKGNLEADKGSYIKVKINNKKTRNI